MPNTTQPGQGSVYKNRKLLGIIGQLQASLPICSISIFFLPLTVIRHTVNEK